MALPPTAASGESVATENAPGQRPTLLRSAIISSACVRARARGAQTCARGHWETVCACNSRRGKSKARLTATSTAATHHIFSSEYGEKERASELTNSAMLEQQRRRELLLEERAESVERTWHLNRVDAGFHERRIEVEGCRRGVSERSENDAACEFLCSFS